MRDGVENQNISSSESDDTDNECKSSEPILWLQNQMQGQSFLCVAENYSWCSALCYPANGICENK